MVTSRLPHPACTVQSKELAPSDLPAAAPPLRVTEPMEAVVADLEEQIPGRMRLEDLPGLSFALTRDGTMIWTQRSGVANWSSATAEAAVKPHLYSSAFEEYADAVIARRSAEAAPGSKDAPPSAPPRREPAVLHERDDGRKGAL